jgi:hypothetical protein
MLLSFKFTLEEINDIISKLGQLPYSEVAGMINAIHSQAVPQIEANSVKSEEHPDAMSTTEAKAKLEGDK